MLILTINVIICCIYYPFFLNICNLYEYKQCFMFANHEITCLHIFTTYNFTLNFFFNETFSNQKKKHNFHFSPADVLANYINSLVSSGGSNVDAYSASDVAKELMRSRKIVGKVRKAISVSSRSSRLSDCDVIVTSSGSDEDEKLESSPSLARIHNEQISRFLLKKKT